jgi:hypothetical protein
MNISMISVQAVRKFLATIALFALVFSPLANVPFALAASSVDTITISPDLTNQCIVAGTPITVSGSATADTDDGSGQLYQYHVQVDWGDGTVTDEAEDGSFSPTNKTHGNDKGINSQTYSDTHTFSQATTSLTIKVRIYHQTAPGNDNQADAVKSVTVCIVTQHTATLTLVKSVTKDNGSTAAATDWTLSAVGTDSISGVSGSANVTNKTVTSGDYTLSESGPTGYTASAWSCTAGTLVGSTLTLADDDNATCTITNDDVAPSLTLTKVVDNAGGGTASASDWTVSATGPTSISGAGSAASDNTFSAGTYTLSETANSVNGTYTAGTWSCDNGVIVDENNQITLALGQNTSCSITNTYVPPTQGTITITKNVTNDNGGTKQASDFTFRIDGNLVSLDTPVVLTAGSHTVSEDVDSGYAQSDWGTNCAANGTINVVAGNDYTCSITNDDIAPQLTIIKHVENDNLHQKGSADASDFTLNVTATNPSKTSVAGNETGETITLDAGAYSVTEGDHSGYSVSYSGDCEGTIGVGETKTCTVTNDDLSPTSAVVTFLKNIVDAFDNDSHTVSEFSFSLAGVMGTFFSGDTVSLTSGSYDVSETGPDDEGYDVAYGGACTGGSLVVTEGDYGTELTCSITNTELSQCSNGIDDDKDGFIDFGDGEGNDVGCENADDDSEADPVGSITIDKVVTGEGASDTEAFNFDASYASDENFDDNFILSGTSTPHVISDLKPGTYTITETDSKDHSRWDLTNVTCEGISENKISTTTDGVIINLPLGGNVQCAFTNTYTPRDSGGNDENIIVKKEVTEGSDSDTLFTFSPSWGDNFQLSAGLSHDSGDLSAGEYYNISEVDLPDGWSIENVSCTSDLDAEREIDPYDDILLNDGETITCTFVNDQDRFNITGQVWNDEDGDGIFDEGESPLADWTVRAKNGEKEFDTVSDSEGFYLFNVPKGTWTISEDVKSDWDQTYPTGDGVHIVTVPEEGEEMTLLDSVFNFFVPTAHAATIGTVGGKNFGNKAHPIYSQSSYNGGNGRRVELTDNGGRVEGDSDNQPQGEVLGASTDVLPVGAPNTGAGGASPISLGIHGLVAILGTRRSVRATHGSR